MTERNYAPVRTARRPARPEQRQTFNSFGIRGADIVGVFVTDPVQVGGYTGWPLEWTDKYNFFNAYIRRNGRVAAFVGQSFCAFVWIVKQTRHVW